MCKGNSPGCTCCKALWHWSDIPFGLYLPGGTTRAASAAAASNLGLLNLSYAAESWSGSFLGRGEDVVYLVQPSEPEVGGTSYVWHIAQVSASNPAQTFWKHEISEDVASALVNQNYSTLERDYIIGDHGILSLGLGNPYAFWFEKDGTIKKPMKPSLLNRPGPNGVPRVFFDGNLYEFNDYGGYKKGPLSSHTSTSSCLNVIWASGQRYGSLYRNVPVKPRNSPHVIVGQSDLLRTKALIQGTQYISDFKGHVCELDLVEDNDGNYVVHLNPVHTYDPGYETPTVGTNFLGKTPTQEVAEKRCQGTVAKGKDLYWHMKMVNPGPVNAATDGLQSLNAPGLFYEDSFVEVEYPEDLYEVGLPGIGTVTQKKITGDLLAWAGEDFALAAWPGGLVTCSYKLHKNCQPLKVYYYRSAYSGEEEDTRITYEHPGSFTCPVDEYHIVLETPDGEQKTVTKVDHTTAAFLSTRNGQPYPTGIAGNEVDRWPPGSPDFSWEYNGSSFSPSSWPLAYGSAGYSSYAKAGIAAYIVPVAGGFRFQDITFTLASNPYPAPGTSPTNSTYIGYNWEFEFQTVEEIVDHLFPLLESDEDKQRLYDKAVIEEIPAGYFSAPFRQFSLRITEYLLAYDCKSLIGIPVIQQNSYVDGIRQILRPDSVSPLTSDEYSSRRLGPGSVDQGASVSFEVEFVGNDYVHVGSVGEIKVMTSDNVEDEMEDPGPEEFVLLSNNPTLQHDTLIVTRQDLGKFLVTIPNITTADEESAVAKLVIDLPTSLVRTYNTQVPFAHSVRTFGVNIGSVNIRSAS